MKTLIKFLILTLLIAVSIAHAQDSVSHASAGTSISALGGSLLPAVNNSYDLGSSSFQWANLYLGGTQTLGTGAFVSSVAATGSADTAFSFNATNGASMGSSDVIFDFKSGGVSLLKIKPGGAIWPVSGANLGDPNGNVVGFNLYTGDFANAGTISSLINNGATAVGFHLASKNNFSTSGAKLWDVYNASTPVAFMDKDGSFFIGNAAAPTNGFIDVEQSVTSASKPFYYAVDTEDANTSTGYIKIKDQTVTAGAFSPGIYSKAYGSAVAGWFALAEPGADSLTVPAYVFDGRLSSAALVTSPLAQFRNFATITNTIALDGSFRVGASTTAANGYLEVLQTGYSSGSKPMLYLKDSDSTNGRLTVEDLDSSSNEFIPTIHAVGIGTSGLQPGLVLEGEPGYDTAGANAAAVYIYANKGGSALSNANLLEITNNATVKVSVDPNGYIASATPDTLFSIYPNALLTAITMGGHKVTKPFTVTEVSMYVSTASSATGAANTVWTVSDGTNTCTATFACDTSTNTAGTKEVATVNGAGTGCVYAANAVLTFAVTTQGCGTAATVKNADVVGNWK